MSPGVTMSWSEMCTWNDETPAIVPAGARISAGKSGRVARSFPNAALSSVNRSPTSCMPSPESPANRITTRSSVSTPGGSGSPLRSPLTSAFLHLGRVSLCVRMLLGGRAASPCPNTLPSAHHAPWSPACVLLTHRSLIDRLDTSGRLANYGLDAPTVRGRHDVLGSISTRDARPAPVRKNRRRTRPTRRTSSPTSSSSVTVRRVPRDDRDRDRSAVGGTRRDLQHDERGARRQHPHLGRDSSRRRVRRRGLTDMAVPPGRCDRGPGGSHEGSVVSVGRRCAAKSCRKG